MHDTVFKYYSSNTLLVKCKLSGCENATILHDYDDIPAGEWVKISWRLHSHLLQLVISTAFARIAFWSASRCCLALYRHRHRHLLGLAVVRGRQLEQPEVGLGGMTKQLMRTSPNSMRILALSKLRPPTIPAST
ncbi:hypothetical protein MIND_01125200 [Mycena indigotica]|uniref:Uncharacterized protein n=1 Tax=Mycena indigotica TaxID=2126181 RepID=A0A8H6S791_9AGAR|nr:uncharacterized protein MIND_01125200 [Mycena indigotica]KAF7293475.1 hypothetical protein MIND_01125200 [Mycena indigotica]